MFIQRISFHDVLAVQSLHSFSINMVLAPQTAVADRGHHPLAGLKGVNQTNDDPGTGRPEGISQ